MLRIGRINAFEISFVLHYLRLFSAEYHSERTNILVWMVMKILQKILSWRESHTTINICAEDHCVRWPIWTILTLDPLVNTLLLIYQQGNIARKDYYLSSQGTLADTLCDLHLKTLPESLLWFLFFVLFLSLQNLQSLLLKIQGWFFFQGQKVIPYNFSSQSKSICLEYFQTSLFCATLYDIFYKTP